MIETNDGVSARDRAYAKKAAMRAQRQQHPPQPPPVPSWVQRPSENDAPQTHFAPDPSMLHERRQVHHHAYQNQMASQIPWQPPPPSQMAPIQPMAPPPPQGQSMAQMIAMRRPPPSSDYGDDVDRASKPYRPPPRIRRHAGHAARDHFGAAVGVAEPNLLGHGGFGGGGGGRVGYAAQHAARMAAPPSSGYSSAYNQGGGGYGSYDPTPPTSGRVHNEIGYSNNGYQQPPPLSQRGYEPPPPQQRGYVIPDQSLPPPSQRGYEPPPSQRGYEQPPPSQRGYAQHNHPAPVRDALDNHMAGVREKAQQQQQQQTPHFMERNKFETKLPQQGSAQPMSLYQQRMMKREQENGFVRREQPQNALWQQRKMDRVHESENRNLNMNGRVKAPWE